MSHDSLPHIPFQIETYVILPTCFVIGEVRAYNNKQQQQTTTTTNNNNNNNTYMTIAEFFIIRPQGPNCWIGLGAFRERVRLQKRANEYDCGDLAMSPGARPSLT